MKSVARKLIFDSVCLIPIIVIVSAIMRTPFEVAVHVIVVVPLTMLIGFLFIFAWVELPGCLQRLAKRLDERRYMRDFYLVQCGQQVDALPNQYDENEINAPIIVLLGIGVPAVLALAVFVTLHIAGVL